MSFPAGSANPYEAPTADLSPVSLAEDTEFLFNDKVVAGIGKISLPDICVISGETSDLVRRQLPRPWISPWLKVPQYVLIGMGIVSFVNILGWSPRTLPTAGGIDFSLYLPLLLGAGSIIGLGCLRVVANSLRQTVFVDWSISRRVLKRVRRIWVAGASVIFVVVSGYALLATVGRSFGLFFAMLAISIGALTLLYASAMGDAPLRILGRHNGLFLIGGFREPFLKEVRRLAALRSSRESGTVSKPD